MSFQKFCIKRLETLTRMKLAIKMIEYKVYGTKSFLRRDISLRSCHILRYRNDRKDLKAVNRKTSRGKLEPVARDSISTSGHTIPNILINMHRHEGCTKEERLGMVAHFSGLWCRRTEYSEMNFRLHEVHFLLANVVHLVRRATICLQRQDLITD